MSIPTGVRTSIQNVSANFVLPTKVHVNVFRDAWKRFKIGEEALRE
jgi:hypothetical protein